MFWWMQDGPYLVQTKVHPESHTQLFGAYNSFQYVFEFRTGEWDIYSRWGLAGVCDDLQNSLFFMFAYTLILFSFLKSEGQVIGHMMCHMLSHMMNHVTSHVMGQVHVT
jgi:hypothetical protein